MNNRDKRVYKLLKKIYLTEFLPKISILDYSSKGAELLMKVRIKPPAICITKIEPDELTGMQYMAAVSQLVYVFISFLISDGAIEFMTVKQMDKLISSDVLPWYARWRLRLKRSHLRRQGYLFELLMQKYKLKFKRLVIDFSKILNSDESFEVDLRLKKTHRAKSGLPLVIVELSGDVIRGEIINLAFISNLDSSKGNEEKQTQS